MEPSIQAEIARRMRAAVVTELPRRRPTRVVLLAVAVGVVLVVVLLLT